MLPVSHVLCMRRPLVQNPATGYVVLQKASTLRRAKWGAVLQPSRPAIRTHSDHLILHFKLAENM